MKGLRLRLKPVIRRPSRHSKPCTQPPALPHLLAGAGVQAGPGALVASHLHMRWELSAQSRLCQPAQLGGRHGQGFHGYACQPGREGKRWADRSECRSSGAVVWGQGMARLAQHRPALDRPHAVQLKCKPLHFLMVARTEWPGPPCSPVGPCSRGPASCPDRRCGAQSAPHPACSSEGEERRGSRVSWWCIPVASVTPAPGGGILPRGQE